MKISATARGFTLVELLATLTLISVVVGIAIPSWNQLIAASRHTSTVNDIHRMFATARSFAIHQKTLTTICPLSPTLNCTNDWSASVSVFPDGDNDQQPDNGKIYRTFELLHRGTTLQSRTAGKGYFQIGPNGMSHGSMGSLIACTEQPNGSTTMSYIALNIGGRLRTLHDDDDDGDLRLPWGARVSCLPM
ncbi:GspH/FimT family pseudopilin [Marinobacter sp.]|uniref:GspH/FimT family pseudopilin n=1 Tax=Marinobacter sp. TaxID=50741 RepID=UPI002B26CE70|nr:GspH/FimT family pseudopilin [Marinobacter sp.]